MASAHWPKDWTVLLSLNLQIFIRLAQTGPEAVQCLHTNPFISIKTLAIISLHPRGLSCGPVAKTSPQTDNRVLLLIWHNCRLPVDFLLYPPQEGNKGLFSLRGALWGFLYEFLSRTMGQSWTPATPNQSIWPRISFLWCWAHASWVSQDC